MAEHSHPHRCHARLPELADRLRDRRLKLTRARQGILEVLRQHAHPISAREVFEELPSRTGDLATVYRSLRLLESMRMAKRFDLGDGVARFELLVEGDDGHHHHLICTQCSGVVEIEGCLIEELERGIAAQNGFKSVTHRLEFYGLCPKCQ
jgi:Fur family ferric uptake transcriptional regulator